MKYHNGMKNISWTTRDKTVSDQFGAKAVQGNFQKPWSWFGLFTRREIFIQGEDTTCAVSQVK